jgi:hypothetical protein
MLQKKKNVDLGLGGCGPASSSLGNRPMAGKCGGEPLLSIKDGEYLDWPGDSWFLAIPQRAVVAQSVE